MEENANNSIKNKICRMLQDDRVEEVNAILADTDNISMADANLRSANLQGLHVEKMDFSNAYLRSANLKGLDLRSCSLEGASMHGAQIAGTYFPNDLSPEEILLSVTNGTRLRHRR